MKSTSNIFQDSESDFFWNKNFDIIIMVGVWFGTDHFALEDDRFDFRSVQSVQIDVR